MNPLSQDSGKHRPGAVLCSWRSLQVGAAGRSHTTEGTIPPAHNVSGSTFPTTTPRTPHSLICGVQLGRLTQPTPYADQVFMYINSEVTGYISHTFYLDRPKRTVAGSRNPGFLQDSLRGF